MTFYHILVFRLNPRCETDFVSGHNNNLFFWFFSIKLLSIIYSPCNSIFPDGLFSCFSSNNNSKILVFLIH